MFDKGVNINVLDKKGFSFLYVVCYNGYNDIVCFLFENNVDKNLIDENGISFFWVVC